MDKRKLRFMVISSILLIISVTTALLYKVYAQKGPILKAEEMKGFYLDKESMKLEKNVETGTYRYTEKWYSIDPKTYHEKSGIDSKTGKLKNFESYRIRLCVVDYIDKKSANKYLDGCISFLQLLEGGDGKKVRILEMFMVKGQYALK